MKKVFALVVIVALLLGVTGCSPSEEKIYKQYTAMNEAMVDVKAVDMEVEMKIDANYGDDIMNVVTSGTMQQYIRSENDMDVAMHMTAKDDAQGESQEMNMYYVDGIMYQEMMGVKIALPVDFNSISSSLIDSTMPKLPFESIKSAVSEKVSEGTKITLELDGKVLDTVLGDQISSMLGGIDASKAEIVFGDITFIATIKKDNMPLEQQLIYSAEITVEGKTIAANFDMIIKYIGINNFDEVKFPSDLDEYQKVG